MRALLIYDSGDPEVKLARALIKKTGGDSLIEIDAGSRLLEECIGCFGCWIKTPGQCLLSGSSDYLSSFLAADQLILLTRIVFGGYSPAIKAYMDRCLPLLHPYFVKYEGEMHHRLRYHHYPSMSIIGFGAQNPREEEIFREYSRSHRDNLHDRNYHHTYIHKKAGEAVESWLKGVGQCE